MKVYILCDIEGVAGLSSWEEARPSTAYYAAAARQMSLEAAAAARGAFAAGATQVIVEDGHGDGRNIDISLLPKGAKLARGITCEVFGLTGMFDESFDALMLAGYHDCASAAGNPASHTIVGSRVASLHVNGQLWGEMEVSAYSAAYRGVPTVFVSGDQAVCQAAQTLLPTVTTVGTKEGCGYSVISRTPQEVIEDIEKNAELSLRNLGDRPLISLPASFDVEVAYLHHYDAKSAAHYPGASLAAPTVLRFHASDYGEVLRCFHFII